MTSPLTPPPATRRTSTIVPLSGTIGAEIRGVDLRDRSTRSTIAAIRRLWLRLQGGLLPGREPRPATSTRRSPRNSASPPRATRSSRVSTDHPEVFEIDYSKASPRTTSTTPMATSRPAPAASTGTPT